MARRSTPAGSRSIPIKATVHANKRKNIPTEELRDFVADDERNPKPIIYERPLLYPRDPDADPQLVWRGKDQQDTEPLTIPAVPLYIQEKIDPRALVEDLRRRAADQATVSQLGLFEDFDGLEGYEQVEFYEHGANWSNRMILGDALLAMNSLAEKERLRGQIQMIYVDPPYGIKFGSNWQVSTRKRAVRDGTDASRQPEQIKAFRDTWQDGIHSYLTYLRDRLTVARELLTDSGSIFVQIGDDNLHLVRSLLDEVFGSENFLNIITFRKTSPLGTAGLPSVVDFILWYARSASDCKIHSLYAPKSFGSDTTYTWLELVDGTRRKMTAAERNDSDLLPEGSRPYCLDNLRSSGYTATCFFPITVDGKTFPAQKYSWKTNESGVERLKIARRIQATSSLPYYVRFYDDFPVGELNNVWLDTRGEMDMKYVVQTTTKVIERCMQMTTDPGDLVLDPTCGSGSTAYVAERWGRRWITIDTSRVALALARTRLMAARYPYYLLSDSIEGAKKEREITGQAELSRDYRCDVRHGFVCRRVSHIMLSSIARNEEIVDGMSREKIDRLIQRTADQEVLVDQPFRDTSKIRVSGRFTVESLSPHRNLSAEGTPSAEDETSYVSMILENLRAAGVQNTFRGERLMFNTLEPYPSEDGNLHAHGTTTDTDGEVRTVAVAIGPEHGTVSPDMVKDAGKEALKGAGFDLLVVCGFAFEAYAPETAKEFAPTGDGFVAAADERKLGRLRVLLAHMNPDLAMSSELLKKTGAGNLFTVFGEPDVVIAKEDGGVTVEVRGVDVYDPTTGVVRTAGTEDIACWFIDTDYDGEQFFVRHAYFTGADRPYEELQRSLNTDVDLDAWASLYSTKSRPFDSPTTGRIAVKVINHFGDEVLKVYEVRQ
jgi:adenine-specific DNA-methyltransferase